MKLIDMTGNRFGRLVVVTRSENRGIHVRWRCLCDCGRVTYVATTHLRTGHTSSCGCAQSEVTTARNLASAEHGMSKTPEFEAWSSMKKRCLNEKHPNYKRYGGRGIAVCAEWLDDFAAFYAHIGPRPSALHSLDRIRNEEGYMPGNVRWATDTEQMNNRRVNVTAVIEGETLTAAQIAARYGISHSAVLYRIHAGKSAEEIVAPLRRAA